jgi:hypothetical protein
MSSNPWYYISKPNGVLQDKRSSHQSHLNGHGSNSQQFDLTNDYDVYLRTTTLAMFQYRLLNMWQLSHEPNKKHKFSTLHET